jgi:uncharacterized membrane protein (DUF2068 family)
MKSTGKSKTLNMSSARFIPLKLLQNLILFKPSKIHLIGGFLMAWQIYKPNSVFV